MSNLQFYEPIKGEHFIASTYDILETAYLINKKIVHQGYAMLNDLYDLLGMQGTNFGEYSGWTEWIDFAWVKKTNDLHPYYELRITPLPTAIREFHKL